jgi:hypothetical protein
VYDKAFITGCDSNTEWMLPWFVKHYMKHNNTPLLFADFGVSPEMRTWVDISGIAEVVNVNKQNTNGWFLKPQCMINSPSKYTCWVDTDIHILGDMSGVFDSVVAEKLSMVEDKPWSKRRKQIWHNSGVVAFKNKPKILLDWEVQCRLNAKVGDQEILHEMVGQGIDRLRLIENLNNKYNWLRIQLLDGQNNPDKIAMHWTGYKGKLEIQKLMYNEKSG